jgi:hypothetical protein
MSSQDVSLFDIVSAQPYEQCEQEWAKVLLSLRLQVAFIPAIQMILKQDRWRGQPNPAAYIRKAAVRCAIREGMIELPVQHSSREVLASDLSYRDANGDLLPHDERLDVAIARYEEKFGSYYDYDDYGSPQDRVAQGLIDEETGKVDWERAAQLAGLDSGERLVVELRSNLGVGREQALSICNTEADRKLLQAAWKRFERHQDALKKVLSSDEPHKSRRISVDHPEQGLELVFVEMPDGSFKISFVKLVPETET